MTCTKTKKHFSTFLVKKSKHISQTNVKRTKVQN